MGSTYPTYCDEFHLYTFMYESVTLASSSDSIDGFTATAFSMQGIPGICTYTDTVADITVLEEGTEYKTSTDSNGPYCGHYVQYEWDGQGDVFFIINSMNAVALQGALASLAGIAFYLF